MVLSVDSTTGVGNADVPSSNGGQGRLGSVRKRDSPKAPKGKSHFGEMAIHPRDFADGGYGTEVGSLTPVLFD